MIFKSKLLSIFKHTILLGIFTFFLFSCSSRDDGFIANNGEDVEKKYISKVTSSRYGKLTDFIVDYNADMQVTSMSLDGDVQQFSYNNNGDLRGIASGNGNLLMSEVMSEIHEFYVIGDVLDYDEKGNPSIIELYDLNFIYDHQTYTANLTYDDKPFTFYYTLDAAGIIDVLNDVRIKLITTPDIVKARKLLMVNNPIKAVITDESDEVVTTINVAYNYNSDGYPSTALVMIEDQYGDKTDYDVTYEYR